MEEKINFEQIKDGYGPKHNHQLEVIKKYAFMLAGVLLLIHIFAFFAFIWTESSEARWELVDYYTNTYRENPGFYYNGIVVFKNTNGEQKYGFSEQKINSEEYLIYRPEGTDLTFAKSEKEMAPELMRIAILLSILYIAEIALFFGWWMYAKSEFKELFTTQ